MASGGGGKSTQTRYGRGASTPTQAQQAASKAAAGKAAAAKQAAIAEVKAAQIKALETAIGGRPAWVDAVNEKYKGQLHIGATIDNGQLAYVTNNLQYYSPQGTYLHEADYGPKGLVDYVGEYLPVLGAIALSFALPGAGSAIAAQLVTSGVMTAGVAAEAVGMAIASTAANMAQGQNFEDALKNSIVNVAVSTGSLAIAKEANALISHPAVTDAVISAAGSAAKTAAAGGTEQDIINNMTGALAGSAASSAYQLSNEDFTRSTGRVIGSAVAGGVTGGATGAITGALGELGGQAKADVSDTLRGKSDTGALPESQVAAMTPASDVEFETKTITSPRSTDITSTNIISPAASIAAPAAAALEPAGITNTEVMNAIAAESTPAVSAPAAEVAAPAPVELEPVTVTAQRPPADITSTDIIDTPAQLDDVTITGKKEETPLNVAAVEEPATVEEPPPEEKPPADKPYKPNLFILGGKQPKAPTKPSTSVLGQALGTTTGLTASRGAGEIEDPSTGKKRKKVWNEETLRLKDALGV